MSRTALIAALLLAVACGRRSLDEVTTSEQRIVRASEVAQCPEAYYGRPVTVVAEVANVHGPNAFTLDQHAPRPAANVLVLAPKGTQPVAEDRGVMVHGVVRRLDVADLEHDYPGFRADAYEPDVLVRFRHGPVIVADSVRDAESTLVAGAPKRPAAVAD